MATCVGFLLLLIERLTIWKQTKTSILRESKTMEEKYELLDLGYEKSQRVSE